MDTDAHGLEEEKPSVSIGVHPWFTTRRRRHAPAPVAGVDRYREEQGVNQCLLPRLGRAAQADVRLGRGPVLTNGTHSGSVFL